MLLIPLLSEADIAEKAEGSIDPLGLYPIADALAVRLVPGLRERQKHPRFLTAIAVSLAVCGEFDDDTIAVDGVSEPWQVFEWYLVEGLVRSPTENEPLHGLPGRDKVTQSIHDGVPISAKRYLKTPTVFGFHGVYRTLAKMLEVEHAGRLGDTGYELLKIWETEQGLKGFCGSHDGIGKEWRLKLSEAINDGLAKGAVARKKNWNGWEFFTNYLLHTNFGAAESKVIHKALLNDSTGYRKEILQFLTSSKGKSVWKSTESERSFHQELIKQSDPTLREFLRTIRTYEKFSRIIRNAYDDCLFYMSQAKRKVKPKELCSLQSVRNSFEKAPDIYEKLIDLLAHKSIGLGNQFQDNFNVFGERLSAEQWTEQLMSHHVEVQRKKAPNGKAPWFDRFDDGSYFIRTTYMRDEGSKNNMEYVNAYRTVPLAMFAYDLGLF